VAFQMEDDVAVVALTAGRIYELTVR
jgi:hypothetical protein